MRIFNKPVSYTWIKENIAIIILIPTVAGGLWQLLELLTIGTAYIRFFSLTQMVPDGILLLLSMSLIISICSQPLRRLRPTLESTFSTSDIENKSNETTEEKETGHKFLKEKPFIVTNDFWISKRNGYIVIALLLGAMIGIDYFIVPGLLKILKSGQPIGLSGIVGLLFLVALFIAVLTQSFSIFLDINKLRINLKSGFVRNAIFFTSMFIVTGAFAAVLYLSQIFHHSFALPDDFKNTDYINCKIKYNNKKMAAYNILYFNDKYIFVRIFENSSKNYIEVFKFDEFTNSTNCFTGNLSSP